MRGAPSGVAATLAHTRTNTSLQPQPPLQYTIRPSTDAAELDAVAQHIHSAFDAYWQRTHGQPSGPLAKYKAIASRCYRPNTSVAALVAVDTDNKIIGSIIYDHCDTIVAVQLLTADPNTSNQGIGQALLAHLYKQFPAGRPMGLTANLSNNASFAMYVKAGFNVLYHMSVHSGYATADQLQQWSDQLSKQYNVTEMQESDVQQCDELHQAVLDVSRINDTRNTLRETQEQQNIALVVRNADGVVGYCTSANTREGHWVWTTADVFKAMYVTAHQVVQQDKESARFALGIYVLMQHQYHEELRFLLSAKGVRIQTQLNCMFTNLTLPQQTKYRYSPSTYY